MVIDYHILTSKLPMGINEHLLIVYSKSKELCTGLSNLDVRYLSPSMDWHSVPFLYLSNFPFNCIQIYTACRARIANSNGNFQVRICECVVFVRCGRLGISICWKEKPPINPNITPRWWWYLSFTNNQLVRTDKFLPFKNWNDDGG